MRLVSETIATKLPRYSCPSVKVEDEESGGQSSQPKPQYWSQIKVWKRRVGALSGSHGKGKVRPKAPGARVGRYERKDLT